MNADVGAGEQRDVAVVGAGITGLVLCRELAERGRDVVVLEADDRPGGVIESRRVQGRVVELGPQRTRLTDPVAGLVDELDLEREVVTAPPDLPLYVYRDGRLRRAPLGPGGFLRTDLLSLAGKARFLAEPVAGPPREEESVADYFRRSFGEEGYLHLLGPLFGGIYASDPARMPARHSLIPLWRAFGSPRSFVLSAARRALTGGERPPPCSFAEGLSTLTDALGEDCGDRLRLEAPVSAVARTDRGFRVSVGGGGRRVEARRVVLTVPAAEAADLLAGGGADGGLERLRRLRYNPLAVVHLESDLERRGFGYQISLAEEGFATRGVTWNSSLFGRRGVCTAYLGGMGREEDVGRDDAWLVERAAREFEAITGAPARPLSVHRTRVPAHDESWNARGEGLSAVPPGIHVCANWESQAGIPSRVREARRLAGELDRELGEILDREPARRLDAGGCR
ncbi:MAG: protoporphyrinogen oxidase [Candidatus Palauibacterales bacterium]|nr:protoporphyrinogen oxidase [Candidatus Palauibacterales bacterium]